MTRPPITRLEGVLLLAAGAVLAGLGVAAGSLGTHLLKDGFTAYDNDIWRTAANYQMYHALALVVTTRILARHPTRLFRAACGLFILGIALFSGSLYAIALSGEKSFGILTPFGGVAFLGAWGCLAVGIFRSDRA
jgi:uncharacterized membrane protein YgdD (TMEM256/DUF423 family)